MSHVQHANISFFSEVLSSFCGVLVSDDRVVDLVFRQLLGKTGWSTVVVNGPCQIANGNFRGNALVPFPSFSSKIGSKKIQAKRPRTCKN